MFHVREVLSLNVLSEKLRETQQDSHVTMQRNRGESSRLGKLLCMLKRGRSGGGMLL